MADKYLDIQTIQNEVKRYKKAISGRGFLGPLLFFIAIWVICTWGSVSHFLWSALCFVPAIGLLMYAYWAQQRRARAITSLDFCLTEDTCVSKKHIPGDANADDRYILLFKKYGKYVEHDGRHYAKIAIGDTCYLLRLSGSKKIYWVFNKYAWQGLVGFEKRGEHYYPQSNS